MLDASLILPWPFWLQHSNSWYSSNTGLNNLTCFLLSVHIMPVFNSRMCCPWALTFIQVDWWENSWPHTTSLWSQGHALSLVGTELQRLWVSWCILINLAILMSAGSQWDMISSVAVNRGCTAETALQHQVSSWLLLCRCPDSFVNVSCSLALGLAHRHSWRVWSQLPHKFVLDNQRDG